MSKMSLDINFLLVEVLYNSNKTLEVMLLYHIAAQLCLASKHSGLMRYILFQKTLEEEEEEEEETEAKPDPLHQLILHFSRTALTEKT